MTDQAQFLKYTPTPTDKFEGFVTYREGRYIHKKKLIANKNGGHFLAFGSFGHSADGETKYEDCQMIDSRYEEQELNDYLMREIKKLSNQSQQTQQTSQHQYKHSDKVQQEIPSFGTTQGTAQQAAFNDEVCPF